MSKPRIVIAGRTAGLDRPGECGIPRVDDRRRADEGDVEQQHQHGNAADDLDVEGRHLADDPEARPAGERHEKPDKRRRTQRRQPIPRSW
jgi:hypothetical protein